MKRLFDIIVDGVTIVLIFCYIDMKIGGIRNIIEFVNEKIHEKKKCR